MTKNGPKMIQNCLKLAEYGNGMYYSMLVESIKASLLFMRLSQYFFQTTISKGFLAPDSSLGPSASNTLQNQPDTNRQSAGQLSISGHFSTSSAAQIRFSRLNS